MVMHVNTYSPSTTVCRILETGYGVLSFQLESYGISNGEHREKTLTFFIVVEQLLFHIFA